jgi:hypothetical protein
MSLQVLTYYLGVVIYKRTNIFCSCLNKEVTVRFGKLKMQLWDSMC